MINTRSTKEVAVIFFFWMMVAVMIIFAVINISGNKVAQNSGQNTMYPEQQGQSQATEIARYQNILKNNPDNLNALVGLGDIYFNSRRYQEAIAIFLKAEKIDPASVHIENDLGLLYLNSNNYDHALEKFQKALQIDPTHIESLYYIGLIHHYKGDNATSLQTFEQVLASNPSPRLAQKVNQEIARIKGQVPLQ